MERENLALVADVINKRRRERLDMTLTNLEQEFNRFFLWIMFTMEEQLENEYPPVGKIIRTYTVTKAGDRRVYVKTRSGTNFCFTSIPTVLADDFIKGIIECIEFIETLDGYGIVNRFPKDSKDKLDEFMLFVTG